MEENIEVQNKRKEEQSTVGFMIQLYCKGNHKEAWKSRGQVSKKDFMCEECRDLAEYAQMRSAKCPYIAKGTKTFCNQCKTPCYKPEYRAKIKKVMRYSGPRMMIYMPALCLRHLKLTLMHTIASVKTSNKL